MRYIALIFTACLASAVSAEVSSMPKAIATWERICREANYANPLDYAVVLTVAGWSELDRTQMPDAAAMFGSLAIHHQFDVDVKTATPDQIRAIAANQTVRFVDDLLSSTNDNTIGVLVFKDAGMTAYTRFRQSQQSPRLNTLPCEMHVVGNAAFLDAHFEEPTPNVDVYEAAGEQVASQMNASFSSALKRTVSHPDNIRSAQISLPQYTYIIESFN